MRARSAPRRCARAAPAPPNRSQPATCRACRLTANRNIAKQHHRDAGACAGGREGGQRAGAQGGHGGETLWKRGRKRSAAAGPRKRRPAHACPRSRAGRQRVSPLLSLRGRERTFRAKNTDRAGRDAAMTAAIVGWAHTPFGKHDAETVESLIVRVATEALEHAGIAAGDVDEILLGHFNGGFSAQDFTAGLVLQASDGFRFKPATRVENACATGSAAVHQAIKTIEAKRARIVLVVGVEQMTKDARSRDRCEPAQGLLPARGRRNARGLRRRLRQDRGGLFPAPRRPVGRARRHRREEPRQRRRQPLRADAQGPRLRLLPRGEREEPLRRRAAQAHRLLARLRRRGGAGRRRRRDGDDHAARGGAFGPPPTRRTSCRCPSAIS